MFKRNGTTSQLEAAIALLLQNEARFFEQHSKHEEEDRQRFARIERELEAIKALLMKHEEMLQKLPDAIREKIGFKQ